MLLKELIFRKSNDYSKLEQAVFKSNKSINITHFVDTPSDLQKSISVVLPTYNAKDTLPLTLDSLKNQTYTNFEIIVIDDGSSEDIKSIIDQFDCKNDIHYIRLDKNMGKNYARNAGISISSGSTILLFDSDMIASPGMLLDFAVRQELLENCVLLGFREHINITSYRSDFDNILSGVKHPNYKSDWRVSREFTADHQPRNLAKEVDSPYRRINFLDETNFFKQFGKGKILGAWDLTSMIEGHTIIFPKQTALIAGGFDQDFTGWGFNDKMFGMRMISLDHYIIPVTAVASYHVEHPPRSGSKQKGQFWKNYEKFLDIANKKIQKIKFPNHKIIRTSRSRNKYYYVDVC